MKTDYSFLTGLACASLLSISGMMKSQVGINTTTPDNNSILDIVSTTKGVLIPRLTQAETNTLAALIPADGTIIYNSGSQCMQIFKRTSPTAGAFDCLVVSQNVDTTRDAWVNDTTAHSVMLATECDGTTARAAGAEFTVTDSGRLGIGTANPFYQLDVQGNSAIGHFKRFAATSTNLSPAFLFTRARGTVSAPADIAAGDFLGKVQFRGRISGTDTDYATFSYIASSSTATEGRFAFMRGSGGGTSEFVSMVANTGNVGIGNTAPSARLHVETEAAASYARVANFHAPANTTAGNASIISLGTAATAKNEAQLRYVHQAAGADSNRLDIGWNSVTTPAVSVMAGNNIGINNTAPSATLDVEGTVEIGTVNNIASSTNYKPLMWNPSTKRVETTGDNSSIKRGVNELASGGTANVGSALSCNSSGCGYDIKIITVNGCGATTYNKFLVTGGPNGYWRIAHNGGVSQNGASSSNIMNNGATIGVMNPMSTGCADGGNASASNYTLDISNGGQLSITNDGNVPRSYRILVEQMIN